MDKIYIFILNFLNNETFNIVDIQWKKKEMNKKYECKSIIWVLVLDTSIDMYTLPILKYLCIIAL